MMGKGKVPVNSGSNSFVPISVELECTLYEWMNWAEGHHPHNDCTKTVGGKWEENSKCRRSTWRKSPIEFPICSYTPIGKRIWQCKKMKSELQEISECKYLMHDTNRFSLRLCLQSNTYSSYTAGNLKLLVQFGSTDELKRIYWGNDAGASRKIEFRKPRCTFISIHFFLVV